LSAEETFEESLNPEPELPIEAEAALTSKIIRNMAVKDYFKFLEGSEEAI